MIILKFYYFNLFLNNFLNNNIFISMFIILKSKNFYPSIFLEINRLSTLTAFFLFKFSFINILLV